MTRNSPETIKTGVNSLQVCISQIHKSWQIFVLNLQTFQESIQNNSLFHGLKLLGRLDLNLSQLI